MRRAVLRCADTLADCAERQIRAAGRTVPPREELLAAVMPAAESAAASARLLKRSIRQLEVAERWATRAGEAAVAAAERTAAIWIAAAATDMEAAGLTDGEETAFAAITAGLEACPEDAEQTLHEAGEAE